MATKRVTADVPVVRVDGRELRPGQSFQGIEFRGLDKQGRETWRIVVYRGTRVVETADGKQKRTILADKFTFTGTWREAKRYKAKLEAERQEGVYIAPARETVGDFITRWLNTTVRRSLRPKTFETYKVIAETHILPAIGHLPLQRLDTRTIDDFYSTLEGRLAPASIVKVHTVLRSALNKAKAEGLIRLNPAAEATPPRVPRKKLAVLTPDQLEKLLEAAKGSPWHALIHLIAHTGIRLGEALGLRWHNVDLDEGIVFVVETLDESDEAVTAPEAKTEGSIRSVRIDPETAAVLRRHKLQQEWLKRVEGHRYTDTGLVFATSTGHPPSPSNLRRRVLYPLCDKAGVPRTGFHQLRHTHATHLLAAGVNVKVIAERLGHRDVKTTLNIYAHLLPDSQQDALAKLAALREEARRRAKGNG